MSVKRRSWGTYDMSLELFAPGRGKTAIHSELQPVSTGRKKSTAKPKYSKSDSPYLQAYSNANPEWFSPVDLPRIRIGGAHRAVELRPNNIEALLIPADDLPSLELTEIFLNEVMHFVSVSAVFLELDRVRCEAVLSWLARLTQAVTRLERRLSHPVLVTIPPDFAPDREMREKIVRAGGLPFFAPRNYNADADKDARLRVLYSYLQELREAASNVSRHDRTRAPIVETNLLDQFNGEDE